MLFQVQQKYAIPYFFYFYFRPLTAEEIALRREKIRMRAAAKSAEDAENCSAENEKDQDSLSKPDESNGLSIYIKSVDNKKIFDA